mmetsp:Transcript_1969/g.4895  ORF Transcript_1969/g.4895 Transcript_1969/m.4895 type:complete len:503 (+) Transcript_1969:90-1598(+)
MALLKSLIVGWLALTGSVPQIAAEIYRFDKAEVPAPHSLHVKHLFYAWAKEKSETNVAQWPVLSGADVHISDASGAELTQAYKSVQLSMVPWGDFHKLIDASVICGGKPETGFLSLQKYPSKAWVISMTVPARKNTSITKKIFKTSVYALVLSNCGTQSDLKISGSISVKNPYGFLPGNEYYRLPLYGWVTLAWAGAGVIWLALLVAKKDAVVWAHIALAWIIISGFGESVAWWFSLSTLNSTGEASQATSVAEVLSVMRNIYALSFILVASMGLGVTEAELDKASKIKILVGTTLFGISSVPRVCLLSMRQAIDPKTSIVILANALVFIVGFFHFIWILRRLAHNMRRCKELHQEDSVKIFTRLAITLCACMLSAAGVMVGQFADKPGQGLPFWQSHVFWNDGVCQAVALITMFATMYFLAPSKSGFLAESYMTHVDEKEETGLTDEPMGKDDDAEGQAAGGKQDGSMFVVGGEGDPEEGEGGSQPSANTIGAKALSSSLE